MLVTELSTAPTVEPVSLADMKLHMRVDWPDEDTLIEALIKTARRHIEHVTGRQLVTATWKLYLDEFPTTIYVPYPPLQSVTSIGYTDTGGDSQTLSSSVYTVDTNSQPGRIVEAYSQSWPATRTVINAITVTYKAGYGDAASDVPEDLAAAVKLIGTHLYENREAVTAEGTAREVPFTVDALLWPYRTWLL